jgi:methionine-S-sulfoxide reductase
MVVGVALGAWAQDRGKPAGRQPNADDPAPTQDQTKAATGNAEEPAEVPFGASSEGGTKDPFDQAAALAKAGDSLGKSTGKLERATFGAGCFWHVEAEFEWLRGVKSAVSGYAGGEVPNPSYEMVHEGETGHIEVVQVEYDPSIITYEQLLKVFWHGHDPTQWNRQGPDVGTQYRSAIFYHNDAQKKAALKSYRELTSARAYRAPIVTLLLPMKAFYRAEEYHQNYYGGKPDVPVGRSTRARRAAAKAVRKGSTAAPKATPAKKEAATSTPAGTPSANRMPSAPRPGSGAADAEP